MKKFIVAGSLLLFACQPAIVPPSTAPAPTPSPLPIPTPTPEAPPSFPSDINPLTGKPVAQPSLLKLPALLVSISHFPATGRPQAGLSFAPFVYEIYITEGATRFLAVFYGEFPAPQALWKGDCPVRYEPFAQSAILLGNRVWLDANANGIQDPDESGLGGVCVNLYDASGSRIGQTTTDSNGYYGFNVQAGKYSLEFVRPPGFAFTTAHAAEETSDSDADPGSGRAEAQVLADVLSVDAGLVPSSGARPASDLPAARLGPIRSGRLVYGHIAGYFQNSCLIYAGASEEVLSRIPQCFMVFHQLEGGGYMLDLDEMRQIAEENRRKKGIDFNYASNLFSEQPPAGGVPASRLYVYIAYQNQSGWVYDPLYQAYLRYVDTSEYERAGLLYPDTDRLTGRQLHFENVIVLFAQHEVISPTNLDIHLDPGRSGKALLFRDGRMYTIRWRTDAPQEPRRPITFLDLEGQPVPLHPGHTWILIVTPDSRLIETSPATWQLYFSMPPGAQ